MSTRPNDPAFPVPYDALKGMSLRAYFAGQALGGVVSALSSVESLMLTARAAELSNMSVEERIATQCVCYADALIAELNKTQQ